MLSKANTLKGYALNGLDGELGTVEEFHFDDLHWTIRYLVAETGDWLADRKVMISPYALNFVDNDRRSVSVDLTWKQIEESPRLEGNDPVTREFEESYHAHFGWPGYWDGPYAWGALPYLLMQAGKKAYTALSPKQPKDPHLRSTSDMTGVVIHALDGEIGRIVDFIIDDNSWSIRYMIVDSGPWWHGKRILISPRWLERLDWNGSKAFLKFSRDTIRSAPEYVEVPLVSREYENSLHNHYLRKGYWVEEDEVGIEGRNASF
ncbi:MAG: PRC-barrel domain-containing protein [Fibrobacterota bacterium]